ncbi:MAG TPA: Ig-like domain-containing protein, partial [Anaerolineales bacterium]
MVNSFSSFRRRSVLLLLVHLLIALSFACSFPIISQETPTPTAPPQIASRTGTPPPPPTPTSTPQPLPPQIIEVDPPPGGELPVQGGITLYFNQAMDRDSVEAALSGQAGRFEWQDDASLTILPESPLTPDSAVNLSLDAGAQAANGLSFSEPVDLHYRVVGYLNLVERLPEPGAAGVDPASAVVATFNLPVVPLGGEAETLPPAFTLSPDAQGRGEWLNTSTYIFYPDGALSGGVTYDVQINPQLVSADGSPLQDAESWTFNTAPPELISLQPESGASDLRLDAKFMLSFNQPMNPDSVAQNLSLMQSNAEPVPGELAWNEDHTQATFVPQNLLRRSQTYQLILGAQAQSMGGTPLERAVESSYETVEFLRVTSSEPFQGGRRSVFSGVVIHFNAPIRSKDILQFVNFSPEVTNLQASAGEDDRSLNLFGNFSAETDYTLTLSPNLPDAWSGRLGQEFTLDFRTLPLEPDIFVTLGSNVLFLTPEESHFNAQIINLSEISLSLGSLSIDSFITLSAPNNFNALQGYESEDERTYQYNLSLQSNRAQPVDIPLTLGTGSLLPGLYYVRFNVDSERIYPGPFLLVVSDIQLTFKLSATDALVWAVDLRDGEPLDDVPIVLYAEDGTVLARGDTDDNGILKTAISGLDDVFSASYAVLGQPGDENFALALSIWSQGLEGWNFGIPTDFAPPHLEAYLYTDRPIYRPGQTVYFRAIARQAYNGRYGLPERGSLPVSLFNDQGERITDFDLALSDFGSGHGSYTLPPETSPGYYTLSSEPANFSSVSFQVAEFRKPEIDLGVSIASDQVQAGETQAAGIQARYFFDAPAGNVPIEWRLFTTPAAFNLPEYQVGIQDPNWLAPFSGGGGVLGELISEGEGRTDQRGNFDLEFSPMLSDARQRYTLEVTAQDESDLPVSARASVLVNPAEYYIGVRPDSWVGQAGTASGFEVVVVDWAGVPA